LTAALGCGVLGFESLPISSRMAIDQERPGPSDDGRSSVSLEAEVPEVLFQGMRDFISSHPHWDQYSVITSALAGFLFQNGCQEPVVSQHYLDGLFQKR
jgi:hypothetical protein